MARNYRSYSDKKNTERLQDILMDLPPFCADFFRAKETTTSSLTRLNYAHDLRLFFNYICDGALPRFRGKKPADLMIEDLNAVIQLDIEKFLQYVSYYEKDEKEYENHEKGKARKLSSIRSLFKYFYKHSVISSNIAALIDAPKIHEKPIVHLEPDEVARLLDEAETGEDLTERQKMYHKLTKERDTALLTLLLGTGIRISELVGLNINDVDFESNAFKVTRKGGNETVLYFGDEIRRALLNYLEHRKAIIAAPTHEDAFFLSLQNSRLKPRTVQQIVAKYSRVVTPLKKISPHKLRSTYGTMLYHETGDIYLVADVLGHKDVNTTRKHYAAMSEEKRRMAARSIVLREDDKPEKTAGSKEEEMNNSQKDTKDPD
ncbi:MAG: tyrosine-type recombinase/integrase [Christensenellales bacterium]